MLFNIKYKSFSFALLLLASLSFAQTGIGTSTPHASAKLHVSATDKGFLPPRVTLTAATDVTTIPSPAEGLLVYNLGSVGLQAGYYYWNGANWATIATASSPDQTVDYVSVTRTSDLTINTNDVVKFNSIYAGTIPYDATTGKFSLTAGKTYKLSASIALSNGNTSISEASVVWKNAAGDFLPNKAEVLSSSHGTNAGGNANAAVIYTPTVNTTVNLIVAYATPNAILWGSFTYANIEQIGSSATVNPWILSGTNTYTTIGNVGIGTSTPNASAILDISSSSKGVLPPKVVLTGRNGTSSPIASPTNGLFVYNTAGAGTASNTVSPGFYFYNGTNWTRMDPEDWSIPVSITINAVTTAPTKGTIVYDKVCYRRTSTTSFEVTYNYSQSTVGTAGSGNYLFRLPGDLTFGSSVLKTTSDIYETLINRVIIGNGYYGDATGRFRPIGIIPYDNNRFRIMIMDNANLGLIVGSSDVGLNIDGASYKFSFILETN